MGTLGMLSDAHTRAHKRESKRERDERLGKVLDRRFRLEAHLGAGGTGSVYRARVLDRTSDLPPVVAIKVLHAHLVSNASLRDVFRKEARIARLIGHEGAVRVFDASVSEDGTAYLVLELLEGHSLHDGLVGWGDLLLDEVVRVTRGVLEILAAAHARGVVHCDIKPENIFVLTDGRVKLLDFGVARVTGEARRTGIAGTLAFMAPEQARGDWAAVDARSDVWSVGATFYTLITGNHLVPGENVVLPAGVPLEIAEVIRRALSRERGERYKDAKAMLDAFEIAAKKCGIPRSSRSLPDADESDVDIESAFTLVVPPYPVSLEAIEAVHPSSRPPPPRKRARAGWFMGALVIAAAGVLGALLALLAGTDGVLDRGTRAKVVRPLSTATTTAAEFDH